MFLSPKNNRQCMSWPSLCAGFTLLAISMAPVKPAFGQVGGDAVVRNCHDSLQWQGDERLVGSLRRALQLGPLPRRMGSDCKSISITLSQRGNRFFLKLVAPGKVIEHESESLVYLASWIESWLLPLTEPLPPGTPIPLDAGEIPGIFLSKKTTAKTTSGKNSYSFLAATQVDFDDVGPTWPGLRLGFAFAPSDSLWLGASGVVGRSIVGANIDRTQFRASAEGGWHRRFYWGKVRLGAGAGVYSVSGPASDSVSTTESGPFVKLGAIVDLPLHRDFSFTLGSEARYQSASSVGAREAPEGSEGSVTTSNYSFGMLAGISWHSGWIP